MPKHVLNEVYLDASLAIFIWKNPEPSSMVEMKLGVLWVNDSKFPFRMVTKGTAFDVNGIGI